MTTDSRKLQLETGVDATGAKAGFQQVKDAAKDMATSVAQSGKEAAKGVDGIGAGAPEAAQKLDRATSNMIASIQRATAAAETGKKSGSAFFESLAGQRNINVDTLKPYLTQLDAAIAKKKALEETAPALDKIGVSAKQTAAALRGVPAQVTDIVTSLQGGQAPLTVLLQQGGQLKDMFGGIGPAAKALGGYVAGLINPFTIAAAAAATLGYAFYTATERTQQFNKALINTGDYVGKSAADLNDLAKAISNTIGTQGQAADALTALAGSGKIAGDSLRTAGEAVVAQNKAMGTSIEEAVGQFVKLGEEPTKASAKLNESLHYLNQSTYDRIRALEEQGDKEAAAALAQDTYAKATVERMQQVINQSGLLSKALSGTKDVALGMWNAIAQGVASIGATQTAAEKLIEAQRKVAYLKQNGSTPAALAAAQGDVASLSRAALRDQENAYAQGQRARDEAAKISSTDRLATLSKEVQTNAEKRKKAIADLDRDFKLLGSEAAIKAAGGKSYDQLVAEINEKYKDPKGAAAKAYQDDAATRMLASLRQQEATLKEQLSTDEKLTNSEKERAKFVQLVGDLKGKANLTEEQKSLLLAQDSIKAQLDKNVALEAEVQAREDARKEAERLAALDKQFAERSRQRTEAISSSLESQNDQYDRVRATFGLGDRARQEVEAQRSIFREYNKMQLDLVKNTPEHLLGSDKFIEESQKIKNGLEAALDAQKKFYADEKAARENWLNGATSALANYIDYVDDAAGRAKSLMTNILSGGNDVLTQILWSGGKDLSSAKQFGERIGKQILSGILDQQIMKPFAQLLQGQLEDSGSLFSQIFGGLTSNKQTGENWLGFLGLGGGKSGSGAAARGSTMANPLYVQSVGGAFGSAANDSGGGIAGVLGGLFGGALSNGVATSAANALPGDALDNLIKLQGGWGSLLGFAGGGDPPMGRVSLVGERGPELFVPKQAGTIIPNDVLRQRGGSVININVPVTGQVDRRTREQIASDISIQQRNARRYA